MEQRRQRGRWKRGILGSCFGLFFAYMIAFGGRAETIEPSTAANISLDLTYGYDNSVKSGRFIPISLTLNNPTTMHFNGSVEFWAMESDHLLYQYDYPLTVSAGETLETRVDIPLGVHTDQFYVVLARDDGEVILNRRLKLNISKDFSELFIGILSDSTEQLVYFDGVGINYGMLKTKTFQLDEQIFPTEEIGLNLLDVILISDYEVKNLSMKQRAALNEWVDHGGLLLLGTGRRVEAVLGAFEDLLAESRYMGPLKTLINLGVEYAVADPGDAQIEVSCVDLTLRGGTVIFSDDQLSLVSMVRREKGAVAVAAFDFKDLSEFASQNPSYVDKLFTNLLGEEKIDLLSETAYGNDDGQYWDIKEMLNTGDIERIPELKFYVIVIIAYLIVIGPVLYFFLRHRQLIRYYRTGVVTAALFFTGVIYFMSGGTRFQNTFFTYATFLDVTPETINETTYLNIRTPNHTPYQVSLNPDYVLKPITQTDYNEDIEEFQITGSETADTRIMYRPDFITLYADRVTAFEPKYLQMDKTMMNDQQHGFSGDVVLFDGKLSGTITNHFDYEVENVTLLLQGQMVTLGTLQAGESVQLDDQELLYYPFNQPQAIAEIISGGEHYPEVDIRNPQYVEVWKKTNVLSFYLENYLLSAATEAKIIGVHLTDSSSQVLKNDSAEISGLTLVASTVDVTTTVRESVYRSGLVKKPRVISGQYDPYGNMISWGDAVVLEYALGNDIEVESLQFQEVSDVFYEKEYLTIFSGNMYFYNYDNGSYELMGRVQEKYDKEQLKAYLSPANTLMVKYVSEKNLSYNWNIILPSLMLVGRNEE